MKRIETLASLVDKDAYVLDIGTDHAYLPIYLYKNNITKSIVGSDISKNALEYAKTNLVKYGLENKIKLIVSDGFKNINETFDIAIISGVGTQTIKKILDYNNLPNKLIISSHKDVLELRKHMQNIGYKIIDEKIVYENEKYYDLIKYEKGYDNLDEYSLFVGLSNNIEYINYLKDKYKKLYNKSHDKKYLEYLSIIERKQD